MELPARGSATTLPFPASGAGSLCSPDGVAVDSAGDVFVGNHDNNTMAELSSVPSGALAFAPATAPDGSTVGVTSVTPCPDGRFVHLDHS